MIIISNNFRTNNSEEIKLYGCLSEFREALRDEIKAIEGKALSSFLLYNGHRIANEKDDYRYSFSVEYSNSIPADTPCFLIVDKNRYDVTVISYEENRITILSKVDLGDNIPKAQLENGSIVLMKKLIERIEQNSTKDNPAGNRMFDFKLYRNIYKTDVQGEQGLNPKQRKAINSALKGNITYIWGPPGTGKTRVIGNIINELYLKKRSVLLVSHTNTAVDGAMRHVCKRIEDKNEEHYVDGVGFPVLRLGSGINDNLKNDYQNITFEKHIKSVSSELIIKKENLKNKISELTRRVGDLNVSKQQYIWMDAWKYNRSEFEKNIQSISELKSDRNSLQNEINNKQIKLQEAKGKFDACSEYFIAFNAHKNASENLNKIAEERDNLLKRLDINKKEITSRQDYLKSHFIHAELSESLSKYLSTPEQQIRIDNAVRDINLLVEKCNALDSSINNCKATYKKATSKSAFGRALSGIDSPEKINKQYNVLQKRRQEIVDDYNIRKQLLQQYKDELLTTKKLIIQRNDIKLVSKPDILKSEINELIRSNEQASINILQLNEQYKADSLNMHKEAKNLELVRSAMKYDPDDSKLMLDMAENELNGLVHKNNHIEELIGDISLILNKEINEFDKLDNNSYYKDDYSGALQNMDSFSIKLESQFAGILLSTIENEIKNLSNNVILINKEISELEKQIEELGARIIALAPIIGITLTKAYLMDEIQDRKFDTVILDEASMASIPALWCSTCLAEKNIVIVGDFKQLSPIVISDNELAIKWLGRDIFDHSGTNKIFDSTRSDADDKNTNDDFCIALKEQFRMDKNIADIASHLYYNGELKSFNNNDWLKDRDEFLSWYNAGDYSSSINILDTKELHAWVTGIPQGKGRTRLNHLSAMLCVNLAFSLTKNLISANQYNKQKALIVSPYRAHTKRIRQLIDNECNVIGINKDEFGLINEGTIHSFQGNEADIVIFDLVVDEPHWSNNLFMSDEKVDESLQRMFNVAITRAKYKLFLVGNIDWCRKRAKNNTLGKLLKELIDSKNVPIFDAKKQFPKLEFVKPNPSISVDDLDGKRLICTQENYYDYLTADILSANEKIVIYSPFMAKDRISKILPVIQTVLNSDVEIYIITKPYSEFTKSEQSRKSDCESILVKNNIRIIHKKKMHEKLVFIDSSVLWTGSLNTLSYSNSQEIMERRQDKDIVMDYAKQMNIEHLIDTKLEAINYTCPACGNEMHAAESDSGGIYWTCSECDYSRNPTEKLPINGELFCSKCDSSISFKLINQPRWECDNNKKHYRKVRRSDLMLPKMKIKIPEEQLLKVVNILCEKKNSKDRKLINNTEREILSLSTVRAFDEKGRLVAGFNSNGEAGRYFGIDSKGIGKTINGVQKSCGGFQWRRYPVGTPAEDIDALK